MPLGNNLPGFLSPTGNMFEPTVNLLNIGPTPIDVYTDFMADLESYRRFGGLAPLLIERISHCQCYKSAKHMEEGPEGEVRQSKNCPHGQGVLYAEVRDPNNFNYKSVLRIENKREDMRCCQRKSTQARSLGLALQRGPPPNHGTVSAIPNAHSPAAEEEKPPGSATSSSPLSPCALSLCSASPNERRKHIPHVHVGSANSPNPNDIIYTDSRPISPKNPTAHTLKISIVQPKNLPFFQFLAMAKAVSASNLHPSHTFSLVQTEAECILSSSSSSSRGKETEVTPALTEDQAVSVREGYHNRYNEFSLIVTSLADNAGQHGYISGCRRMSSEEKAKRLDNKLQELEANFNFHLPL